MELNKTNFIILTFIATICPELVCNASGLWPHTRALFWTQVPMKNRAPITAFITDPTVRAAILLKHAEWRVDSLIRNMPNNFDRTLSPEDRRRKALLTRQLTERIYPELILYENKRNPVIEYIETLAARTHNQHPALAIKPRIFLASPPHSIKPTLLGVSGPDIIINYREFMSLGNSTQSPKKTQLTNTQQFLLNTTWQALSYGDQYVNRSLSQVLELTWPKDNALPTLRELVTTITMAQKLRNDLAAANTTTVDDSGKLMGAGVHQLSRLAHREYDYDQRHFSESTITTPVETQARLTGLIAARNLIEGSDRRS